MFWLVIFATLAVATAFSDGECDQLMEVVLTYRDSLHSENGGMGWRRVKVWALELINLDLDADADLRETLCNMADSGIKTMEDLHDTLNQGLRSYGAMDSAVNTAFAYSSLTSIITHRIRRLEYDINQIKTKLQFFEEIGFPNFPLGFTSEELAKMLNIYDDEVIGNIFWQIIEYDESNNWKATYNMDKLANALAEAEDLDNFIELLNGYPSYYGGDYQQYEKPSEEDIQTNADNIKMTENFIQEMKRVGLWGLPRSNRKLSCDSVLDDIRQALTLLHQVFPIEYKEAIKQMGFSYIFNHESRLTKWICQFIESKSQTEMAKLFPDEDNILDGYLRTSHGAMMMLAKPGLPLFYVNKAIVMLKALEEIDFPHFPLHIKKDKAAEIAEKLSDPHWDNERKEKLALALQNAHSLTDFDENYDLSRHAAFRDVHDKLQGHVDEIEHFFFMAFRVLTEVEVGGLLMLPQ